MYSIQQVTTAIWLHCEAYKGSICLSKAMKEGREECLIGIKQLTLNQKKRKESIIRS